MTTTRPTFDLLIPSNGQGPSHLRIPGNGLACHARTGRKTFQQIGIVYADAGTCEPCRAAARALDDAAHSS